MRFPFFFFFYNFQAFKTSDSWIVVGAGNNKQFQDLCERIGLNELALEDNYASNLQRVKHREELVTILSKRSGGEWVSVI